MLFFKKRKKTLKDLKSVPAYVVASHTALFFYGLQSRFGIDAELVRLSCEAVSVCSAICERLKFLE